MINILKKFIISMKNQPVHGYVPNNKLDINNPPQMKIKDPVNPAHYKQSNIVCKNCQSTIECIDITRHKNFNLGNAIKYIWRCEDKGNKVEDLKKAIWYLNNEIEGKKNFIETKNWIKFEEKNKSTWPEIYDPDAYFKAIPQKNEAFVLVKHSWYPVPNIARLEDYGYRICWASNFNDVFNLDKVTHWQPLPELPKEGE